MGQRTVKIEYTYPGSWGTCFSSILSPTERMMLMSTYEELQLIVSIAVLIVAILSYAHKK